MLKNLLLALTLVALTGSLVAIAVMTFSSEPRAPSVPAAHELIEPGEAPVLAGTDGAIEVIVKRRHPSPRSSNYADSQLARSLGIDHRKYALLEVLVLNVGKDPVHLDLATLELEMDDARRVSVSSLRELARQTGSSRMLLAAHSPDPLRPLAPGKLRRGLVAVEREVVIEQVVAGSLGDVPLSARVAATALIEAWLEHPRRVMLTAVLGDEGR